MRIRPISGPVQVLLLSTAMGAGAVAMLLGGTIDPLAPTVGTLALPVVLLAVMFCLAEACAVHVQLRRQTLSVSLSEIPVVLGLFFVAPLAMIVARLVGSLVALLVWRRQPPVKAAYNMGYFALDTCVMLIVFRLALGDGDPFGPAGWLAAHLATVAGIIIGSAAVGAAMWLTERVTPSHFLHGLTRLGMPTTFVNTTLGLLAATMLEVDVQTGVLLLCLSASLYVFYRSHTRLQTNHESLGELYAVTRTVDDALERGGAVRTLLEQTADLMRAETAELVLSVRRGAATRFVWNAEQGELSTIRSADDVAIVRHEILGDRTSIVLSNRTDRHALERLGGHKDAVLFAVSGDTYLAGTLMVADRLGNVATFSEHDRRLFEALGNHASIAMRNSTLLERLRVEIVEREHEALHDRLTGLPNRTLFDRRVGAALEALDPEDRVVVMLIDLDRFKEVNDTLGHQQGDRLLQHVSRRISNAVGDDGLVARLGGDEFAVLLPDCPASEHALAVAERIRSTVDQPFDLDGLPLAIGASIGIATAPDDADDPESLLQRADVAMYTAKQGTGIERYQASANQYSPERLAMVAELRKAIDRGELLVEYQPCIDLRTGEVVTAEALARWHHPGRGMVPPDEFIPIAERSGLIRDLTALVLRTAVQQCASWRRCGLELGVSVNLSARSLLDDDLPAEIDQALRFADLPPNALTLEITESTIMDDPDRTIRQLSRLSSMGITLSIDDYGTGYSSLAYLKNLPVDELKIDRAFVTNMRHDPRDTVIVRNTIDLAHELGLRVVAEGIEDAPTQLALAELGCDLAQGYHVCRPRTSSQLFAFASDVRPRPMQPPEVISLSS